jgi:protease PrsW
MILFIIVIVFIAIAGGMTWFFLANDHGEKEPVGALWAAAGLGLLGAVGAAVAESHIIPPHLINHPGGQPLGLLLLAALSVGLIEESFKFLPLALFIYKKSYFNEHSDGVIYFALAGLGFGIPENILYSLQFGAGVGLARIIMTPLFHAATTGMVGYFLAKSKIEHRSLMIPAAALFGAMLLHGLYDFGLMSGNALLVIMSLMITAGVTTMLFVFFMLARETDKDAQPNSAQYSNFCRFCGYPNAGHSPYCTYCGQHA